MLQAELADYVENGICAEFTRKSAIIHLHEAQQIQTALCAEDHPQRRQLERFVQCVFKRVHGARISHFMPQLMSLRDAEDDLLAVCGLRHAAGSTLFLERYLEGPIELALSASTGEPVARDAVVEVGNLAVANPANIRSLLSSLSLYLHQTNTEWAVFTGIKSLRNALQKLNMPLHILADASLDHLPLEQRADWGSYYEQRPQVMAIRRAQ